MSTDHPSALPADNAAAEWAAAETASEVHEAADQVSPASFANFAPTTGSTAGNDINMILDIPVQLTVEQLLALKAGDFIELDLHQAIQAKVAGVPVLDCHYGTSNGKYALKVDQLLAGSRDGWLGENNVP